MLSDDDDSDDEGADDEEEEDSNGPQAWIGLKYNITAQASFQSILEAVSGPILRALKGRHQFENSFKRFEWENGGKFEHDMWVSFPGIWNISKSGTPISVQFKSMSKKQ